MGFRAVGKSSLTIQFVENHFVDSYDPTIENTFQKSVSYKGQDYLINVVDTAGQDEYSIFPRSYTVDVDGYLLVYSVTSMKSFDTVKVIRDKLLDQSGTTNIPLVLVGNKTDLHMQRVISTEMGKKLAADWKASFVECSAKQNEGVEEIFQKILQQVEQVQGNDPESGCTVL